MKPALSFFYITLCSTAFSQGLYDTSVADTYEDESSIKFTGSARVGYDDNTQPIGSNSVVGQKIGSAYLGADIRGDYDLIRSNTTINAFGKLGVINYFSSEATENPLSIVFNGGFSFSHALNERLRLSSNNYITHGYEPDYERGIANDRRSEIYTAYSSYNSLGIRWSRRFGTRHALNFVGADYGNGNEYSQVVLGNSIRFRYDDRTILKAGQNIRFNENSKHYSASVGLEHSFSERTGLNFKIGAGGLRADSGYSTNSLYLETSVTHQSSEKLSFNGYAKYGVDDNFTQIATTPINVPGTFIGFDTATFQAKKSLRAGLSANYAFSPKLSLYSGLSVVHTTYIDQNGTTNILGQSYSDIGALIFNINAGIKFGITDTSSAVFNMNHTTSSSDEAVGFDYSRNRYSLGVESLF